MIAELESGMLAGDEQPGRLAEGDERLCYRTELDGFRTRSDNERNSRPVQLPP